MPRHDYRCPICLRVREVNSHGISAYLIHVTCGECPDKPDMERLPAAPNFVLKGAGFHSVDYAKEKK